MSQYEHSLIAMKRLLDAVGETYWADWIETDIEHWRSKRSVSRHLSAYGGMTVRDGVSFQPSGDNLPMKT